MEDQPNEQHKDDDAGPEDPLVLLSSPLHHPDGVTADTQRIPHTVQLPLRTLQHVSLLVQISEYRTSSVQEAVELGASGVEERGLAEGVVMLGVVRVVRLGRRSAGEQWI